MKQHDHARKFTDLIEWKRYDDRKEQDQDGEKRADQNQLRAKKRGIPAQLHDGHENEEQTSLVFFYIPSPDTVSKNKSKGAADRKEG